MMKIIVLFVLTFALIALALRTNQSRDSQSSRV
jgi:hypothetical protein